jgi:maltose O-acetyltransferase
MGVTQRPWDGVTRLTVYCFYAIVASRLSTRLPGARWLREVCARQYCSSVATPVNINPNVRLSPSLVLRAHAGIGARTVFLGAGQVVLCEHVTMGPDCTFITGDHPVPSEGRAFRDMEPRTRDIMIEQDVFLGASSIVLPGVTIGRGAAIGAGTVVTRDVPPGAVVVGNPGRVVRTRPVDPEPASGGTNE